VASAETAPGTFEFRLEFDCPDAPKYYLACKSDNERLGWMEVLRVASYEHMRSMLLSLRRRLIDLTQRDPLKTSLQAVTTPQVPSFQQESVASSLARHEGARKTVSASSKPDLARFRQASLGQSSPGTPPAAAAAAAAATATAATAAAAAAAVMGVPVQLPESTASGTLELSLACDSLPLTAGRPPNPFVVIQVAGGPLLALKLGLLAIIYTLYLACRQNALAATAGPSTRAPKQSTFARHVFFFCRLTQCTQGTDSAQFLATASFPFFEEQETALHSTCVKFDLYHAVAPSAETPSQVRGKNSFLFLSFLFFFCLTAHVLQMYDSRCCWGRANVRLATLSKPATRLWCLSCSRPPVG
jgi:hypothetical protein